MTKVNRYVTEVANNGELPNFSMPGGYPIIYSDGYGNAYCGDCAVHEAENIMGHDCYMEGSSITCEGCNDEIESAYGDPSEEGE